jgi:hypothetical protein
MKWLVEVALFGPITLVLNWTVPAAAERAR